MNGVQAWCMELQGDEAYYWLYSKYLAWGYYDHPPMVAVFIWFGDHLMHNELGLRLLTVIASSVSLYLLWRILKKYAVDARAFVLVSASVFIFHIYGFTTTPDAPLFFFTVLFYFVYQQYLEKDSYKLAVLLGVVVAGLLYSKYNGILVIAFTLLANLSLFKKPSFWLITIIAVILYMPHIIWQVQHEYPSINYHLFDRANRTYDFTDTFSYLPGQLFMAGPLVGWFFFYRAFKAKISDPFIRCLIVNCAGTLLFFFISSSRGEVQPQWTFVLFAPLILLSLIGLQQTGKFPKWLVTLAIINISLILIVRIIIIGGFGFARTYGHLKSYYGFKEWATVIKQKVGNNYVVMNEGFQNPSKYDYYTNSFKCFAYDARYYRRTQFDIWPIEDSIQRKRVYYLTYYPVQGISTDSFKLSAGTWYGGWIDEVRSYQKIIFEPDAGVINASPGERIAVKLNFKNPYPFLINFSNSQVLHKLAFEACFLKNDKDGDVQQADSSFYNMILQPCETKTYAFLLTSPKEKGTYKVYFSMRTDPFPGSRNSKLLTFTVK